MMSQNERTRLIAVTAAVTVVLVLAGLLLARIVATDARATAPAAQIVEPAEVELSDLEFPCWSCSEARKWPLRFRTDLDTLAPLGNGEGNAGEYFVLFEKDRGLRFDEARAFMKRRSEVEGLKAYGKIVAFDDLLLLEAEPWVDQGVMRYYPDLLPIEGMETRIPNLLVPLAMARTWAARGVSEPDTEVGLEDCRRAIRLGRLLRQEDFTVIADLVGLVCIQVGAQGIFDIAQNTGNTELGLLASIVLGEVAPQRLLTSQRVTSVNLAPYLRQDPDGRYLLDVPEPMADTIVEMAATSPDRRFRGEAIMGLFTLLELGTPHQQDKARTALEIIEAGDDPRFVELARWSRTNLADHQVIGEIWLPGK